MDIIFVPFLKILTTVITLYTWVVIIGVVLNWLTALEVVNAKNKLVSIATDVFMRLTEPALTGIRRYVPSISGLDFSPVILILGLHFLGSIVTQILYRFH